MGVDEPGEHIAALRIDHLVTGPVDNAAHLGDGSPVGQQIPQLHPVLQDQKSVLDQYAHTHALLLLYKVYHRWEQKRISFKK